MATTDRPNILFVFPDQQRPDWVGYDGDVPVRTPNLDALTDDGVAFRNAVCPSPFCGPSRAALASGREYDRCGVRDHTADYPLAAPTLYGRLRDAGYHVLGTGKFDIQKHSARQGMDGKRHLDANGFSDGINNAGKWDAYNKGSDGTPGDPYTAYLHEEGLLETHVEDFRRRREGGAHATFPSPLPERAYCDNYVGRNTVDLLRDAPEEKPWFVQVNFTGPHDPWDVTEEMHEWYREPPVEFPEPVDADGYMSPAKHQAVRRNFAAMVENIDRWVGRLLDVVEERNERANTLVVFASDHGEMLGDHGEWGKSHPRQESTGVPMVVAGPGVAQQGVVDTPATILDLHATFLDYAGLDPRAVDNTMDSISMRSYLEGAVDADTPSADGGPRDVVFTGFGPWRLAFDGRYKLIRGYSQEADNHDFDPWDEAAVEDALQGRDPMLFDLETDRHERSEVAKRHPDIVDRLSGAIDSLRTA